MVLQSVMLSPFFAPMFRSRIVLCATLLLCCSGYSSAQSRLKLGFNGGGTVSRVIFDTIPKNFSRRNLLGYTVGICGQYDLKKSVALQFGINYTLKGYKVTNDTLTVGPSIIKRTGTLNIPIGITFRQAFNSSNYIQERFGFAGSFSFGKDSSTKINSTTRPRYQLTEVRNNANYPMFYLGFGTGGKADNGDRWEFGLTYFQSFAKDASIRINHGANFAKSFPLNYRGGFLSITFSYYFNLANFKKSSEYFE